MNESVIFSLTVCQSALCGILSIPTTLSGRGEREGWKGASGLMGLSDDALCSTPSCWQQVEREEAACQLPLLGAIFLPS